jgi:RNA polymerase sigma-70 factor (ECF subfamily)
MAHMDSKTREFEEIINSFSEFIKANIQKFNPQSSGIDVNDVAQEVKIKLWKVVQSEKRIKYISSFIKRVVYSTTIDIMRKIKREKEVLCDYQDSVKDRNTPPDLSCQEEINQLIGQAVDSLMESRRKVIRLYLLGMDVDEIAEFFTWTRDKVRNLLYRGLSDLKVTLKEKGVNYEGK